MFKQLVAASLVFISFNLKAQTETPNPEMEALKKRVLELEEVQAENSEIIKRQLGDQHIDQNSRGYIELKAGMSLFQPDDIEDMNDDELGAVNNASWEDFGHANIFDLEIGKSIYISGLMKHEIGVGYQFFNSKMTGSYPSGGGTVSVKEKVMIHTMYARYAMLFEASRNGKFYIGPGITLGYSPVSELKIELEKGNEGSQVTAESTSFLVEVFGKAKIEFSRYFSFVAMAGYRMQEAEELRVNSTDVTTVRTNTDLDASGFFGMAGLAAAF